jgi:hypothetical protein
MRAAVLHEYGVPRAEDLQEPEAGPGQGGSHSKIVLVP